ncbi:Pseudouridylate synthase, partial [Phytophthora palmivora]
MDSRRGRRFDHNNGRKFRRGGRGSGSVWFKGEGYNDHESVCIAEEVAGISGFLNPRQRGFKGVMKQRFADFVVHELSLRNHQPITLQSVAKKSKTVQLTFQERVLDFVLGVVKASDERKTEVQDKDELIGSVRQLARKLQQTSLKQQQLGQAAQEAYHLRQLVVLV